MYPETDIKIYPITKEYLKSLEVPVLIDDKVEQLIEKHNLPEPIAREVVKNNINLESYLKKYKLEAKTITNIVLEIPKEIKRRFGLDIKKLKKENYEEVLNLLDKKDINKEAKKVKQICSNLGYSTRILKKVKCGQHAPYTFRVCFDIKILP